MSQTEEKLRQVEQKIQEVKDKIASERQNLIDSGHGENTQMFAELFSEIKLKCYKDLLPLFIARHELRPYLTDERKEIEKMYGDVDLDDPPPRKWIEGFLKSKKLFFDDYDPKEGEKEP